MKKFEIDNVEHTPGDPKRPARGSWKRRLAFAAPVSAALAFTIFFFGPLDLFFNNHEELWFNLNDILGRVALTAIVVFVLATLAGVLIWGRRLHRIYMSLLFGGLLGAYIQGSFMNKNYGSLDGTPVDWGSYTGYGVVNLLIWLVCLLLPLVLMYFLREKRMRPVMIFLSLALILMQGASLVVSRLNYTSPAESATLTTEDMYDLSDEANTLVFIVDTMDERYFQNLMDEHPEYVDKLTGFTSYDNALASGARTPVAVPLLLTGIPRTEPGNYNDYISRMWDNQTIFKDYKKAGYDVRLYTESRFVTQAAQDHVENLIMSSSSVKNYRGLNRKLYKLTLYKYVPHFLKWRFWMSTNDFDKFKRDDEFTVNDAKVYENYKKHDGFTYDYGEKCFRLYHFLGSHHRFTLKKDGTHSEKLTSLEEQTEGDFYIIFDMLNDLKENGVYDKCNILICADHGDLDMAQWAACLYKPAGATGDYQVSHAPISFFDLPATLDAAVGGDVSQVGSGQTLDEAKEGDKRTRTFYQNQGSNATLVSCMYQTDGPASDADQLKLVKQYKVQDASNTEEYTLGTELFFTVDKPTGNAYCTKGFLTPMGGTTTLAGPHAQMVIPIKDAPTSGNLSVEMRIRDVLTACDLEIRAGGETVLTEKLETREFKSESLHFTVPASALEDGTLTLDINFPSIPEDEENLDEGDRTKVVRMKKLVINAE